MSLKLRQRLLKRFALIATVSIVLTAFFSTAAYWLVFSSQENTNLIICAQTTVNAYNVDKNSIKYYLYNIFESKGNIYEFNNKRFI